MDGRQDKTDKLLRAFELLAVDAYTTPINHPDFVERHRRYKEARASVLSYMIHKEKRHYEQK